MKIMRRICAIALCGAMAVGVLAACGSSASGKNSTTAAANANTTAAEKTEAVVTTAASTEGKNLGFTEVEIFSGVEKEFLNLTAVYFQPVDMTGGYKAEDYDCHLELDIKALQNGLGYGTGDWVPYLTIEYEVKQDGWEGVSGTFMPMAASDGPHYGANIKLNGDGVYTVTFTIKFPDSSTYLIHTDGTGPEVHKFPDAIVYTYDKWQYTKGSWAQ